MQRRIARSRAGVVAAGHATPATAPATTRAKVPFRRKDRQISATLSALEEEGVGQEANHQGLQQVKTDDVSVLTKTIEEII